MCINRQKSLSRQRLKISSYTYIMKNEFNTEFENEDDSNSQPGHIVIINCALNAPLMFISIVGNSLVLAAISRTPSFRSPSYIFLCSLAVSDLLVGLIVQPLFIASQLNRSFVRASLLDGAGHMIAFSACGVSLCTMATMSLDRYMALHYHMRYEALVTISRVFYTLATIWFVDFVLGSSYFWSLKASYCIMAAGIGTCIFISTYSYIRIYRIVQRHRFQIQVQQQVMETSSNTGGIRFMRLKKSAINTFVFYIFIILCYVPKSVSLVIYSVSPQKWECAWVFANTVLFFNSFLNPILYCWRISELRKVVLNLLRNIFQRQTVEVN